MSKFNHQAARKNGLNNYNEVGVGLDNILSQSPESLQTPENENPSRQSALSLPTGGGAIRGISENFSANPVTGTASLGIPLPVSPARGFQPDLTLRYDSGAGNSAFGLGWNVSTPSIQRKTDRGLPSYDDMDDADTYSLVGAEDLVPFLVEESDGFSHRTFRADLLGTTWEVKLYRPRIEGAYAKIERWRQPSDNRIWWRTVSGDNVTTVYGLSDSACVYAPGNRGKTFQWLAELSYDDKGNLTQFVYAGEDGVDVDFAKISEKHRKHGAFTQRYLKKALYGLKESWIKRGLSADALYGLPFEESDFHFQTVFDYGDHPGDYPTAEPEPERWPAREDPFSSCRAGFEVRTYRRCARILLFHSFPAALEPDLLLVHSLELGYTSQPQGFSYLESTTPVGYKRAKDGRWEPPASFPAMTFDYQAHKWNKSVHSLDAESLADIPAGVDGRQYQWTDLYGEGLSGVVTEQAGTLTYKQNLGSGVLARASSIAISPSQTGLGQTWQLQDLEGNGIKSLVTTNGEVKGYYQFDSTFGTQLQWQNFSLFREMPNIRFDDPDLRIIDLNGDGKPDILITDEQALRWFPSKGRSGYGAARRAPHLVDEDMSPGVIFSNRSESIFIADMTGDGLSDVVRIRNGEVCYWPNMGHGVFGHKVCMENAPHFNHPELFSPGHIRLADIDGSGTTDIIYLGKNAFRYWLNKSGNALSETFETINPFPQLDDLSSVSVIDLLGTGTACVVWSSPLPSNRHRSIQYVDLMGSYKPHLLQSYKNGSGKSIHLEYTPSTHFYLQDKAEGKPWVTRLHFPVHCLSKVKSVDHISGAYFATSYSYHHGYYDHAEREFRGFGRVDQLDSEHFERAVASAGSNIQEEALHQPPILTRTWFHTGAYIDQERILNHYATEYCDYQNPEYQHLEGFSLDQPALPEELTPSEWREALRACKGRVLRTETYGLDGSEHEPYPYTVTCSSCDITRVQAKAQNAFGVFQVLDRESVTYTLDRKVDDPKISHTLLLETSDYGSPTLSASVQYGRRLNGPSAIEAAQQATWCIVSENRYTEDEYGLLGSHDPGPWQQTFRQPVVYATASYELGMDWQWSDPALGVEQLRTMFTAGLNAPVPYVQRDPSTTGGALTTVRSGELRLLSRKESRFANLSLDGAGAAARLHPRGINWKNFQLALTADLVETIYYGRVTDNMLVDAGYVHLDGDDNWWAPSGHPIFQHPEQPDSVENRFYVPFGTKDALGAAGWLWLDDYVLLPVRSAVSRAGFDRPDNTAPYLEINPSHAVNDYRTLQPRYLQDANQNWSGIETDARGMVVKTAIMGKVSAADQENPPADNAATEGDNLDNPSVEISYGFYQDNDTVPQPGWGKTRTYTRHFVESGIPRQALTDPLDYLEQYQYSDGSGNVVMVKQQSTPGMARAADADGNVLDVDTGEQLRWIVSGRVVVNNKGKPVREYEPYFSTHHRYESEPALEETGVSSVLFHDTAGRMVCRLLPNGSYEKTVFGPWQQQQWDANDTLFVVAPDGSKLTDPASDPDVGPLMAGLTELNNRESWYAQCLALQRGDTPEERQRNRNAAVATESHAATPSVTHMDSLGRAIYAEAHNRVAAQDRPGAFDDAVYATTSILDIEGNLLDVTDARDNRAMSYLYGMLPAANGQPGKPALYQNSMDGGERWLFMDVQGKTIKSWDSREHVFESVYDDLQRPLKTRVQENQIWKTVVRNVYVDSDAVNATDAIAYNLLGLVWETFDQSGRIETSAVDFKGNVLRSLWTLATEYKQTIDWDGEPGLEAEVFYSESSFDALNRTTQALSPHNPERPASRIRYSYNTSGRLRQVHAAVRDKPEALYVDDIEYDARGQRQKIQYGNGLITTYAYEPDTFRLKRLVTIDGSKTWQDLSYTYDPVGNITEIHDNAQSTVYFDNAAVEPHNTYAYDPLYRLISASGREHALQANCPHPTQGWDALRQGNHNQLQRYTQAFSYDPVGNIESLVHARFSSGTQGNSGWTRRYTTDPHSNRLLSTELSCDGGQTETYQHNAHGSITAMPHLPILDWDFAEQLRQVDLQGGGQAYYVYDGGGKRIRKVIETNGSLVRERIYLGGWEVYRETNAGGLRLERETLHIMDNTRRIALVETKTYDTGASATSPIVRYQLSNHLGSACWEIGDDRQAISYEEYHAYGTTAYHAGTAYLQSSAKRYRYTGKERDEESSFSYHGARYYVAGLCMWTAVDPLQRKFLQVSGYQYCTSNPVIFHDMDGAEPTTPAETEQLKLQGVLKRFRAFRDDPAARERSREGIPKANWMRLEGIAAHNPDNMVGLLMEGHSHYEGRIGIEFFMAVAYQEGAHLYSYNKDTTDRHPPPPTINNLQPIGVDLIFNDMIRLDKEGFLRPEFKQAQDRHWELTGKVFTDLENHPEGLEIKEVWFVGPKKLAYQAEAMGAFILSAEKRFRAAAEELGYDVSSMTRDQINFGTYIFYNSAHPVDRLKDMQRLGIELGDVSQEGPEGKQYDAIRNAMRVTGTATYLERSGIFTHQKTAAEHKIEREQQLDEYFRSLGYE